MAGQQTNYSTNEMFEMAVQYYDSKNYTEAVMWLRKVAEQGYAAAQYNFGRCYARGETDKN